MERLYHFNTLILLTIILVFLSCSLTGCTSYNFERSDNTQLLLHVPEQLLEPVQPLVVISNPPSKAIEKLEQAEIENKQ